MGSWLTTLFVSVMLGLGGLSAPDATGEPAPVRLSVSLLPGSVVVSGELLTIEARIATIPVGQPGSGVPIALVDLILPDGRVLPMTPSPADPERWTQHVYAEDGLGPGRHELWVVAVDARGRAREVALTVEVLPSERDLAAAP